MARSVVLCWGIVCLVAPGCLGIYVLQMPEAETLPLTSTSPFADLEPAKPGLICWVGERTGSCGELGRVTAGLTSWERQGGTTELAGLGPCSLDMDITNTSHPDFHNNAFSAQFSTFS